MNKDLNTRVKEIRKQLKLSQKDFAASLSIQQGSLSDIERGRIGVSTKVSESLIEVFNMNPVWFRTGVGDIFNEKKRNKVKESTPFVFKLYDDLKSERPELHGLTQTLAALGSDLNDLDRFYRKYLHSSTSDLLLLDSSNYLDYKKKAIKHLEQYLKFKAIIPVAGSIRNFIEKDAPQLDDKKILSNPDQD